MNDLSPVPTQDDETQTFTDHPSMRADPPHVGQNRWDSAPVSQGFSGPSIVSTSHRDDVDRSTSMEKPDTVLVVDDSAVDRRLATHLIERAEGLGLRIAMAANGQEALDRMEQSLPAIVLTDLQMPKLDGLALVRTIRERHPEIPVVLMTAHGSEEIAVEAIRAGAASYVPKKSLTRDLVSTLQGILEVSTNEWKQQRILAHMESRESRFSLGNEAELHAPLIGLLQEDLKCIGAFDATTRIRIGVAIQEALNNAMFHGNLEVSSDLRQDDERIFYALADERRKQVPYAGRKIRVGARVERSSDSIYCEYVIGDEGPGFDTASLDRPLEPEDLMRIGGRGLLLIRAFMDQVIYNEAGNQITMIKRDPASPAN
jgi:CheY-like chemotaxis protein/anti-sigma regulatory factor (Ser/Thr protein kinase)